MCVSAEMANQVDAHRYPRNSALLGIRGLAASAVVIYHCGLVAGDESGSLIAGRFQNGFLAVDIFFIISGYVIAKKYLESLMS